LPDKSNFWPIVTTAVASVLIGFALSTLAYRMRILRVPGGNFVERLDNRVHLTPAQREQVTDIIQETRFRIETLRRDFLRSRRSALWDSYEKVRGILTPPQQKIFDSDFSPPWGGRHEGGGQASPAASPSAAAE
jgi:hypothetical protein